MGKPPERPAERARARRLRSRTGCGCRRSRAGLAVRSSEGGAHVLAASRLVLVAGPSGPSGRCSGRSSGRAARSSIGRSIGRSVGRSPAGGCGSSRGRERGCGSRRLHVGEGSRDARDPLGFEEEADEGRGVPPGREGECARLVDEAESVAHSRVRARVGGARAAAPGWEVEVDAVVRVQDLGRRARGSRTARTRKEKERRLGRGTRGCGRSAIEPVRLEVACVKRWTRGRQVPRGGGAARRGEARGGETPSRLVWHGGDRGCVAGPVCLRRVGGRVRGRGRTATTAATALGRRRARRDGGRLAGADNGPRRRGARPRLRGDRGQVAFLRRASAREDELEGRAEVLGTRGARARGGGGRGGGGGGGESRRATRVVARPGGEVACEGRVAHSLCDCGAKKGRRRRWWWKAMAAARSGEEGSARSDSGSR